MRFSVAMTKTLSAELSAHLTRADGDEDVCIATYTWSTGKGRRTALLREAMLPQKGDRLVHGNASFNGGYVLRAATEAARRGEGIVLLHSHPGAVTWQGLSGPDRDTESEYQRVAQAITGLPLVGMTLGTGAAAWSARLWPTAAAPDYAEAVRVVGDTLATTWFDVARPVPAATRYQKRTVAAWGAKRQADIARLRVLVVGVGSVGLDIAARLAATGIEHLGVMDIDVVEDLNLDRMVGATRDDAVQRRRKTEVAARIATAASTANSFTVDEHNLSITDPAGLKIALDYDVIFSCVDRPWPRSVLNGLAYSDLIPVIDGGIALETLPNGEMRGGTWRAHAIVPGRPCMQCNGQLHVNELTLDRDGRLDDPEYIRNAGLPMRAGSPNVAALAASVSAAQLAQFVSLVAAPAGMGVAVPLRYWLAPHHLEHLDATSGAYCAYENGLAQGDDRIVLTGGPTIIEEELKTTAPATQRPAARLWRRIVEWWTALRARRLR